MKPVGTNNLSFLKYVGLFILFHLPYVGDLFLLGFAIFGGKSAAGKFARIILIIQVVLGFVLGILSALLDYSIPYFSDYFEYGFPVNDGIEAFLNVVRTVF